MKTNPSNSTSIQPSTTQTLPPPMATPVPNRAESDASRSIVTQTDLQSIVLPLPAFLTANSRSGLLEPHPMGERDDPRRNSEEVRLCYQLAPQFFHTETPLDKPLIALLRANSRRSIEYSSPLEITVELSYAGGYFSYSVWSALVIATKRDASRDECVRHANRLLRSIARLKIIQPLTDQERTMLGRVPASNLR